jgi:hypothetical protein
MGFLKIAECSNLPERSDPPDVLEYTAAEWWVRERYVQYFREKHNIPQLVTWQLQRFFTSYDPTDPVLDLVMTIIERDFRNVMRPSLVKRFKDLLKAKAPQAEMLALLKEITPGGALKPDMLGISASDVLEFDGLEVGTVKTAKATWDELNNKLGVLNSVVLPQVKIELPNLAIKLGGGRRSVQVPTSFVVRGSAFRLPRWARVLPLPVRISASGQVTTVDWICFQPTAVWYPPGAKIPGPTDPDPEGTDGLVIYHIHRAALPQLPQRVRNFFESELRKWKQQQGLILELNPAYASVFHSSQADWSPEARQAFAYFGLATLVVLGVAVAWEIGLIAGAASLAADGLAGLAATPGVLAASLSDAALIASRLWPAAVTAAPLLPLAPRP